MERDRQREYLRIQAARRRERIEGQMCDARAFGNKAEENRCASWLKFLQGVEAYLSGRNHKKHTSKTVYIAGKMTGDPDYEKKFAAAAEGLRERGWRVLDPAKLPVLPYELYYPINCAMLDGADAIYMLADWTNSPGAVKEFMYAGKLGIEIIFERGESCEQQG